MISPQNVCIARGYISWLSAGKSEVWGVYENVGIFMGETGRKKARLGPRSVNHFPKSMTTVSRISAIVLHCIFFLKKGESLLEGKGERRRNSSCGRNLEKD